MDYVTAFKQSYIKWLQRNDPEAYARAVSMTGGGMAGLGGTDWTGALFDTVKAAGSTIFSTAVDYKRAQDAEKTLAAQQELALQQARIRAVDTIAKRDYAQQAAQIAQIQAQNQSGETDTLLMFGMIGLAALVAAKVMKVI